MGIASKKDLSFWGFTLPTVAFVFMITLIPFALNFYYSMFKWDGMSLSMTFVSLDNFSRILTRDKRFHQTVFFTIKFAVFYVSIVNILAFTLSLNLKKVNLKNSINRSLYYIPHIVSLTAVGLIWRFIFGPGFNGINTAIPMAFLERSWLGDKSLTFYSVLIVAIWQNVGFYLIIYIAGLQAIPGEVLEAAEIDGASGHVRLFKIIIPMMIPAITICTLTSLMYALKLFDLVLVLTKGGPAESTMTIAYSIYMDAFSRFRFGMATAKSVLFFIGILLVTLLQLKFMKSREVEA